MSSISSKSFPTLHQPIHTPSLHPSQPVRSNLNPTFVTPSIPNTTISNGRQDNVLCHPPTWSPALLCFADNRHSNVDVLVIGAGPTGLGAAKRLQQIVGTSQTTSDEMKMLITLGWSFVDDH